MIKCLRCPCSNKDTLSVILVNEEVDFMKVQCDECGEIWNVKFEIGVQEDVEEVD